MSFKKIRDKLLGVDKIRFLVKSELENNKDFYEYRFKELKAFEILKKYFPEGFLFETSFSMPYQEIQHIMNDIIVFKPKKIIEFGAGLSSIIIGNFIDQEDLDIEYFSIDSDLEWIKYLEKKVKKEKVKFIHSPIISESIYSIDGKKLWYDLNFANFFEEKKFDLVIVDGPKGSICDFSRFGFINFLRDNLGSYPIIFIDDTHRNSEKFIATEAKLKFQLDKEENYFKYSRISRCSEFFTKPS